MTIYVDADACPVTDTVIVEAGKNDIPVILVCDPAHEMRREGARTIVVEQGGDSADYRIANLAGHGDIVVTQDYGLAAIALARGARALSQNGLVYSDANIDALLFSRHAAAKNRRSGIRTKGPSKRTKADDARFLAALRKMLKERQK